MSEFAPIIPRNKIAFHADSSVRTCDHCGGPATLRCAACPSTDMTYYCSKECQKADWKPCHKLFCANKQFYALTRSLNLTHIEEAKKYEVLENAVRQTRLMCPKWYLPYLFHTTPEQRPITMLGNPPNSGTLSRSFFVGHDLLQNMTPAQASERAAILRRTTYKGIDNFQDIPYGDRQCYNQMSEMQRLPRGIMLFWTDYEIVSCGLYKENWGEGQTPIIDPWAVTLGPETGAVRCMFVGGAHQGLPKDLPMF